ncbi:MAG: FG-GAP-like repeat-containing protein, partial [Candidatus Thiodiazotropha endolucinida]|nr:FG-GAP-like repeat-containing protein [Candidatus Thiodiazotropha taylori]MCW4348141.1 FG-GAP-like repeat-containing protein [Candidatus Thiodiazotropha endolucinida]
MRRRRSKKRSNTLICEELEPRILLSADLVGVAVDPASNDVEQQVDETELQTIEAGLQSVLSNQTDESDISTRELVIIDPATPDYQSLVDDLISRDGDGRSFEIVLLDSSANGIEQLNETLAQYQGLNAIHLISHGGEGEIRLGNAMLNQDGLQQSAEQISAWGEALNPGGDWLIYGCDIASTATGERFIEQFAALTGADVAASNDVTGHETLDGDWDLEVVEGSIETDVAVGNDGQEAWLNRLDTTTGLLGHWTLDSNAADSSGNSHDGTLTNGALIDNPGSSNPIGGGNLNLDGFNDFVQLNTHVSAFSGLSQGTIAAWINTSYNGLQAIFTISDTADYDSLVVFGMDNGRIFFDVANNNFYSLSVETNASYADGNWHHVAVTVDDSGNSIYIDGTKVSLAGLFYRDGNSSISSFISSVTSLDSMAIGNLRDPAGYTGSFNGLQDDVRVYDRALSASDIAELLSNTAPSFTAHTITSAANGAASVTTVDMDGDGDLDVVSASQNDNKIAWYENDGGQNFTAHTISTAASGAFAVTTADVDGDGDMDVLSASITDDKIAWYENDGNENFTAHTITLSADIAASVAAADVDGDGDIDVLSASVGDDRVVWYENDGNENFSTRTITSSAVGASFITTVDLDEDGDLDVLSTSTFDNRVAWYENDGNENFTTHTVTTSATEARQVIAADVDGDGDLDLLSASRSSDKLAWYENDGFENFTLHTITAAAGPVSAVAAADIDGDGDLDVISASYTDDNVVWFENDGSENFTANTIASVTGEAFSVAVADMDGDGDVDVLATDDAADAVTWYENVMSVTTLDGAPTFVEDGAAVVLDADVNVSDAELDALNSGQGDYNGASLTLVRIGAANSDDVFSFNDGNGITLSGSNLIKSSQIIASFDTTSTAGELVITFTNANGQTPTSADVDNILRQITYSNSNDAPPASVQIDWTFDDGNTGSQGSGGALQAVGSTTVTITAVNDDPTNAGSLPSDITVAENVSSNVDLSAVDFSDVDAGVGTLTVTLTTSTGGNLSAAAGTGITIGGTSTARTLTGTLSDLNNYFNTASNITYLHGTPDTNGDDADTINITINDNGNTGTGGGTNINLGTVNVDITPDNEVPTIANLGGDSLAYNEDDGAQVIDQGTASVVADVDSSDFDTGTLTVSFQAGSDNAEDVLAIRDQGAGPTNITVSGSAVSYGGTQIGTFTGGSGGTNLVITLDADADATAVTALVRNITYENTDTENPTTGARTVRFVLTDGDGGTSVDYDTTVTVSTVNDDPTNAGSLPSDISVTEDVSSNVDLSAINFADVDAGGGTLTVTLTTSIGGNLSAAAGTGITIAGTSKVLTLTGTLTDLNNYFDTASNITYLHGTAHTVGNDADTINVTINDNGNTGAGGGTDIDLGTVNVDISAVNEAPSFDGVPSFGEQIIDAAADGANTVHSADLDGDGDIDVLSTSSADNTVAWHENDGSGNFTKHVITNTAIFANDVTTADVDGDGDLDVLSSSSNDNTIAWYENDGSQNFTQHTISNTFDQSDSVTTADIDGDGDLDVVSGSAGTGDTLVWFENDGSQNFTRHAIANTTSTNRSVTTADVDGDGDFDILSASFGEDTIGWYENDGNGNFTEHTVTTSADGARAVDAADVDGDGDLDVLSASGNDDKIAWYENDGSQNFTAHTITTSANGARSVTAGDMDGDGDLDVLSASSTDATIAWYENDGSENFSEHIISNTAGFATSAAVADVTSDGDLDVLSAANSADEIAWYENVSTTTLDGTPVFTEDGPAVVLDADVDISDPELDALNGGNGDYDGASVTLVRNGAANSEDVFSFNDGNGITLSGSNLIKSSQIVASFDTTTTAGELVITFTNANGQTPTSADVNNILRQITYANSNDVPPASVQIDWTFNDGNAGAQGSGGALQAVGSTTVTITAVNDAPTLAATAANDSLTENTDTTSGAVFGTVKIDPIEAGDDIASAQLTLGGGIDNSDTLTINGTAISGLGSNSSGAITGGHSYSYTQATGVVTITFAGGTNAAAAELVLESITYGIDPADQNPSTTARTITLNTVTDNGGGSDTSTDIGETATISVGAVNDDPTNAGSLLSDISVTEDVSSNVDLSAIDFSDIDAGAGTLTVTLTTSTGGNLSAAAGSGITIGGTSTARTLTGTLTDLNNYFNTTSNITYLHGTANTNGNDADTINVTINDNGNTGTGGGTDIDLGTVNVDIGVVNDAPTFNVAGTPTFTQNTISTQNAGSFIASVDLDGDGDIDVLTTSGSTDVVSWYENDGAGNFTERTIASSDINERYLHWGDLDSDGDLDVVATSYTGNQVLWFENDGAQNFTEHVLPIFVDGAYDAFIVDLNEDGHNDLVVTAYDVDDILWLENDGAENFTANTIEADFDSARDVEVVDFDGDGDLDVVATSFAGDKVSWFENDGNENFSERSITTSVDGPRSVNVADIDDDGDLDVVTTSYFDNEIIWYENDGSHNFTEHVLTSSAVWASMATTSDVDGDGDIDIVYASDGDDTVAWFDNDGSENFTERTITTTADRASAVAPADIDGDGDIDVVSVSWGDNTVAWYANTSSLVNTLDGAPTFVEGGAAVVLDADVDVSDPELDALNGAAGNYGGASLTLVRNGGANADDVFSFNAGNGITLSGGNLIKNSLIIATFDTTTTAGELVITFTDANGEEPTSADVDNVLRQITYANSSDTPPATAQIDWTFDDGNTGSQGSGGALTATGSTTVTITAVNDDPTNTGSLPTDIAVTEDVSSNVDLSALDFSDVDAAGSSLTVTLTTSTGGDLSAAAGAGITIGGTSTALTGTLTDLNNYFNPASNITYLHGTPNTAGNDADTINVTINDNGNTGTGGGTNINLGTVNVDITAVNDDPSNAGSLPSDISVTEDVSSNVDLSAVDFSDVDAASGTLTVTLTTSTGGDLSAAAGTGITLGGTPTALTLTGTLADLNNYFNTASNITYLHGTANTNGNDADTINVTINDNGNTGSGGGTDIDLGTVNVDIGTVNDPPTLAATAVNDSLTENSDTTSGAVFATVTIDPIEAGDDIASAQLTLGGGIANSDTLTINGTAISGLGSNSSGAISGGHSYSYTQATGVVTITFAASTNAAAAELVLESITYGINPADQNPSTIARTITLNTVTDNGGGSATSSDIGETATISVGAVNDDPTNAGSLPSDISVTEDVSSNIDLSAIDFSDIDAGAGTLTVTLTTSTGGDLSAAAGTGITIGGTSTALTLTGTLTDLNN